MESECQVRIFFSAAQRASFKNVLQPCSKYLDLVSLLLPVKGDGDVLTADRLIISQYTGSRDTHWRISVKCTVEVKSDHTLPTKGNDDEYVHMILDSVELCGILQITACPFLVLKSYNGASIKASLYRCLDGDAVVVYDLQLKDTESCDTLIGVILEDELNPLVVHCEIPPNYFSLIFDKRDSEYIRFVACSDENSLVVHIITSKKGHDQQVWARYGSKTSTVGGLTTLSNRLEDLPAKLKRNPKHMDTSKTADVDSLYDFETVTRVLRDLHASSNAVRLSLTKGEWMRMRIEHGDDCMSFVEVVFAKKLPDD